MPKTCVNQIATYTLISSSKQAVSIYVYFLIAILLVHSSSENSIIVFGRLRILLDRWMQNVDMTIHVLSQFYEYSNFFEKRLNSESLLKRLPLE